MVEIACAECGKAFVKGTSQAKFCSQSCGARAWRKRHPEYNAVYMKKWAAKNADKLAAKAIAKRKGWREIVCAQCNTTFQQRSGPNKFCSPKCRRRARNARPEEKIAHKIRWNKWVNANRERVRKVAREHYHRHAIRKHHAQPWGSLLHGRGRWAKENNVVFELTTEWAAARWKNCCELTGIPFASPEQRVGYKNRNFSPSVDKIDPTKGYTQANSRFVIWAVNSLKRDGTDEQMYRIAAALIQNRPSTVEGVLSLPG